MSTNRLVYKLVQEGVLLLNTVLTVRAHQANSHQGHGWEQFTDAGCRIIYGIDYTKVHSKLYTDLSLMTANEEIA